MSDLYPAETAILDALRKAGEAGISGERLCRIVAMRRTRRTSDLVSCSLSTLYNHLSRLRRKAGVRVRCIDGQGRRGGGALYQLEARAP